MFILLRVLPITSLCSLLLGLIIFYSCFFFSILEKVASMKEVLDSKPIAGEWSEVFFIINFDKLYTNLCPTCEGLVLNQMLSTRKPVLSWNKNTRRNMVSKANWFEVRTHPYLMLWTILSSPYTLCDLFVTDYLKDYT